LWRANTTFEKMKSYFLKYFVLISEQTIFGFSNFFYLAVVARRLTLDEFAELSLGYTCYLFLIGIHHSLICDPIIAFGNRGHDDPKALLRRLWTINVILGGLALAVGCVLAAISGEHETSALTIAALACLFFSCAGPVQLLRRNMHVQGRVDASASASAAYAVVLLASAWMLPHLKLVSHFAYTLPFILGNLVFLISAIRHVPAGISDGRKTHLKSHFRFGFSFLINNLLGLATTNIYPFVFLALGSPEAVAGFRLIFGVISPFAQLFGALSGFITPRIASTKISEIDLPHLLVVTLNVLAPLPFAVAAIWFGNDAANLIFGAKYAGLGESIPVALISVSFALMLSTVGMWLRANHRLGLMQAGALIAIVITAITAFPMCSAFGITGAFASLALANGVAALWVGFKALSNQR
jgi:O-antigen/teichoic acid export membrane protein